MDFRRFLQAEQKQQYITKMRPVLNKKALFSDTSENFVMPYQPSPYDEITVRFRVAKNNVDHVFFVQNGRKESMRFEYSDDNFDYYYHKVQLENEPISYYFEVRSGRQNCLYDARGVVRNVEEYYFFRILPGFCTPDWAKGAVMYQIFVDRFCNGDESNDVLSGEYRYIGEPVVQADSWEQYPDSMDVRKFYGGDLQGVLDKLDYLQDLGVDVIYFNPIFVSPSNHKYDIQDYDYIDPHIAKIVHDEGELLSEGQTENRFASRYIDRVTNKENLEASNRFFAQVVEEIHKRGMKVILDGVFNHCGSFNKWMDRERIYENEEGYPKGAYVDENSPYRHYFQFHRTDSWPYNGTYDGWWGHDTLPKLNYEESRELYDYILYIGQKWVSPPYNVDGWRLDVAADLGHSPDMNHRFWQDFRNAVKAVNPEAIVLAEHYGSPRAWLEGGEWDTVMNYDAFMEPITWFLTGMEKHSDDYRGDMDGNVDSFREAVRHAMADFSMPSLQVAMNELSNHDHSRFLTRTNKKVGRTNNLGPEAANEGVNKAVFREAVVMQMTWVGAPTIYYGDEAGLCGFTDPDNRRTYPWGKEDEELINFHKEMIRIHKKNPEFVEGSMKYIGGEQNVISYGRFLKNQQSVVIVNNNDHEITKEFSVWEVGVPKETVLERLIFTSPEGYTTEKREYEVRGGRVSITLPKTSAVILKCRPRGLKNFLHFR